MMVRRSLLVALVVGVAIASGTPWSRVVAAEDLPSTFAGGDVTFERIETHLAQARSVLFRPVGTSSIVFQTVLEGEIAAALRPRTRRHPFGHKAEVAAYRLARALGMDNVPPAIRRRLTRDELKDRLHRDFRDAHSELDAGIGWNKSGSAQGAAIYWIPEMRSHGLDRNPGMAEWGRWLRQGGTIPEGKARLASDLATMLAFDYLIGNWDRFSGGNVQGTAAGDRLFVRDHNLAFAVPLPAHLHERIRRHLERAEKFSRSFVRRVASLDEAGLREIVRDGFARDDEFLLTDAQIRGVLDRRQTFLSYVGALVEESGEEPVLAFP